MPLVIVLPLVVVFAVRSMVAGTHIVRKKRAAQPFLHQLRTVFTSQESRRLGKFLWTAHFLRNIGAAISTIRRLLAHENQVQ